MTDEPLSLSAPAEATPAPTESAAPAETTAEAPETSETRQELIAGKFKSVDDLTKAYKELESRLGKPAESFESVDTVLERASLRGDDVATNWREHGRLTDDQYAALEKIGYGRKVVDDYMTGQAAVAATRVNAAQEATQRAITAAGGAEQWSSLTQWARDHYSPEQIQQFDQRLADPTTSDSAVKELLYDYRVVAGNSVSPSMVHGDAAPATSAAFATVDEVMEAMTRVSRQGYLDEATKRRFARTPKHLFNGVNA